MSVFEGVPKFEITNEDIKLPILNILAEKTKIFKSKGEGRRMILSNAVSINKIKITEKFEVKKTHLLNDKYLLIQKGKKNYFLIIVS